MLPSQSRLRSSDDFRLTVRGGVRAARPTLVVHIRRGDHADVRGDDGSTRVGFVVSKQVGNAVVRNRVKRRLRHLVRDLLPTTPTGLKVVVRALPPAASEPGTLADDLADGWRAALGKLNRIEAR